MQHWTIGIRHVFMPLGFLVVLMGCALQSVHHKSLPELRQETASHYSQQVLETIVGVCDEARVPVFFGVENSFSEWALSYSGSVGATIPVLKPGQTGLTVNLGGGETLSNQIQYNDFSSPAMSRVTSLYGFFCFGIQYHDTVLPNGTFYTAVDTSDSQQNFLLWTKRRNGQYVGVTPAKTEQLLRFAHDVTYWTQHADPNLHDLLSTTGRLYRFSVEYNTVVAALVQAKLAKFRAEEAMARAQEGLKAKQQEFEALKEEAKTSKVNPLVLQTLLQLASQEPQAQVQTVDQLATEIGKLDRDILSNARILEDLVAMLDNILAEIKKADPDLTTLDTAAIIETFQRNLNTLLTGNREQLEALKVPTVPSAPGYNAKEPVDQLYRERFEALPPQFDPKRQGLQ